jgi:hypothetical protein
MAGDEHAGWVRLILERTVVSVGWLEGVRRRSRHLTADLWARFYPATHV